MLVSERRRRSQALWMSALFVGSVACQFSSPGDVPTDAPPADAPTDAAPDVVTGRAWTTYRTEAGDVERGIDLTTASVAALIPDPTAPGGFRIVNGTGQADGTFLVAGVAPGLEYFLKIGSSYYWTHLHELHIRVEIPGRADTEMATMSTPVSVPAPPAVGGLPLYETSLVSLRAGVRFEFPLSALPPNRMQGDWGRNSYGVYEPNRHILPSATADDDLWILQHRRQVVGNGEDTELVAAWRYQGVTVADGQRLDLADTAQPITEMRSVDVRFGALTGYRADYGQRSSAGRAFLSVHALPALAMRWFTHGALLYAAPIATASVRPDGGTIPGPSISRTVPDPFPESWPRVLVQRYERIFWYRVSGDLLPATFEAGMTRVATLPLSASLTADMLLPPDNVTVGGLDGTSGGGIRDTSGPITVTWGGVPNARQYAVMVLRITPTAVRQGATLITTGTSLAIPPEAIIGGEFYSFVVTAFAGTNDLVGGELYPAGVPAAMATTATGPFRISATCGDGIVDADEECDDGPSESAGCDRDCTFRACGDGVLNRTAGELCDTIVDTEACDASDCTSARCGDGYVNSAVEQCDDGNAVDDGNGCSAMCRLNRCGDSVVQSGEQCDAGGASAACDADCTLAVCGDYVINAAAGEQCDDGGTQGADGCSADCQLE